MNAISDDVSFTADASAIFVAHFTTATEFFTTATEESLAIEVQALKQKYWLLRVPFLIGLQKQKDIVEIVIVLGVLKRYRHKVVFLQDRTTYPNGPEKVLLAVCEGSIPVAGRQNEDVEKKRRWVQNEIERLRSVCRSERCPLTASILDSCPRSEVENIEEQHLQTSQAASSAIDLLPLPFAPSYVDGSFRNRVTGPLRAAWSSFEPATVVASGQEEVTQMIAECEKGAAEYKKRAAGTRFRVKMQQIVAWIGFCYILIFLGLLAIICSLTAALWRSIGSGDISGSFSIGQYILGVGMLVGDA